MNQTAMTDKAAELIAEMSRIRIEKREEFKETIQNLVDKGELDYAEAIQVMKESRLFEVSPYILTSNEPIDILFEEYNEHCEDKYVTVYFTDIVDWIDWSEGEVQEALDAAGIEDPYKLLYDYVMETNYIGYVFDW